jgi:hypothetical protein
VIRMFEVGELVVFLLDGARGIIVEVEAEAGRYHIAWEDFFLSWEKGELLKSISGSLSK